jgi:hypothetical protein
VSIEKMDDDREEISPRSPPVNDKFWIVDDKSWILELKVLIVEVITT